MSMLGKINSGKKIKLVKVTVQGFELTEKSECFRIFWGN